MKFLLLVSVLLSTTLASAQQGRQRFELENQILEQARNMEQVLKDNLYLLQIEDLRKINVRLRQASRIARGLPIRDGDGGGTTLPPRNAKYLIKVSVEDVSFLIEGGHVSEIQQNCENKLRTLRNGRADDISAAFDAGAMRRRHNSSSYWTSTKEQCQVVTDIAIDEAYKKGINLSYYQYLLKGHAEGNYFLAQGNSLQELESSCVANLRGMGRADDLSVSLNGGPVKRQHNSSSYWTTPAQVCSVAMTLVY